MSFGSTLRRHLSEPRLRRRWLCGAVTLGLTTLPLVGTLGYENGFVLSPLAAGLGAAIGVDSIRAQREATADGADAPAPLRTLAARGATEGAWLVAIAVGTLLLGQIWQRNCDPWGGLGFFALGPLLSMALGWVCGLWGGALAQRRGRQLWLAALAPMASTAIGLWRLWADPVVFAFDPFFGYFSGAIYDEAVSITSTYLNFRAYNVLAAAAGVGLWRALLDPTSLRITRPKAWGPTLRGAAPALVAGGLAVWIGLRGATIGFTANIESITKVLSATVETEHFIIHYVPRSPTARMIDAVATEHELAWHGLQQQMGRAPSGKVRSFVFANARQKRALMGAGTVQVAAPWRQQIYLDYRGFPHPVLPHELAHIFGNTVGDRLFGVSLDGVVPNMALIEGFATALAPRSAGRLDLHDQATVLERLGKRPPLAAIMGPKFYTKASRVAYTTAGSFCRWLIDTRGFEGMATLYFTGGDFAQAYGEPLADLEAQWLKFLAERPGVTDDDVEATAQRFRRRSVFARPCAHRAATLRQQAAAARNQGRFGDAIEDYETLCRIEPERPQHKIGLAQALAEDRAFDEALATLDEALAYDDLTVSLRATILERRADVALAGGELAVAVTALDEALTLPVTEDLRRGLLLKREAARDPQLAPLIADYYLLFQTTSDAVSGAVKRVYTAQRIAQTAEHRRLGHYLLGRQLMAVQGAAAAIEPLRIALSDGPGRPLPGPEFVRAARLQLMSAYVQVGRYDQARAVLASLDATPDLGNGHRLIHEQWRARIEFFAEHHRP